MIISIIKKNIFLEPINVACWFINRIDRDAGESITHLKLQKLVYYAQAWFLANFDRGLFEEDMQAWTHGPVTRSIYAKYQDRRWDALEQVDDNKKIPDDIQKFLERVHDLYGQMGAKSLEKLTHSEKPWIEARGNLPLEARCTDSISKLTMRNFYGKKIEKEEILKLRN